jgi:orotidine-5'-phosphate decarboxylase
MAGSNRWTTNPLIVALDVDDADQALALAKKLRGVAGAYKIGPRLVLRHQGPKLVEDLSTLGPVFLDHKFYDIPNTVEYSLRAAFDMGITMATVHASMGLEALKKLKTLEDELNKKRPFLILSVTVLTSVQADTPKEIEDVKRRVKSLTSDVAASGLRGLVCSPHELAMLHETDSKMFFVTPGIRSSKDFLNDQKRVMSAAEARRNGASAVVVGRPILEAKDPVAYARELLAEMN